MAAAAHGSKSLLLSVTSGRSPRNDPWMEESRRRPTRYPYSPGFQDNLELITQHHEETRPASLSSHHITDHLNERHTSHQAEG